jgi:opacity protein-like surface antigen
MTGLTALLILAAYPPESQENRYPLALGGVESPLPGVGTVEEEGSTLPSSVGAPLLLGNPREPLQLEWSFGAHLGIASAFDSDDVVFDFGLHARVRLLSWLGAEAAVDFHTPENYEGGDIRVFEVPIQLVALFYVPVPQEWKVKPYGAAGVGLYIADITYHGSLGYRSSQTALEPGLLVGFGAEYELTPQIVLNADLRFAFPGNPGGMSGDSLDFIQLTVGVSFKLGK